MANILVEQSPFGCVYRVSFLLLAKAVIISVHFLILFYKHNFFESVKSFDPLLSVVFEWRHSRSGTFLTQIIESFQPAEEFRDEDDEGIVYGVLSMLELGTNQVLIFPFLIGQPCWMLIKNHNFL